jgi:hypothetical protein
MGGSQVRSEVASGKPRVAPQWPSRGRFPNLFSWWTSAGSSHRDRDHGRQRPRPAIRHWQKLQLQLENLKCTFHYEPLNQIHVVTPAWGDSSLFVPYPLSAWQVP